MICTVYKHISKLYTGGTEVWSVQCSVFIFPLIRCIVLCFVFGRFSNHCSHEIWNTQFRQRNKYYEIEKQILRLDDYDLLRFKSPPYPIMTMVLRKQHCFMYFQLQWLVFYRNLFCHMLNQFFFNWKESGQMVQL